PRPAGCVRRSGRQGRRLRSCAMTITVSRLAPSFAARIDGADITRPLPDATWAQIRAAFEEHSVLLFRGQPLDDEQQIAFSRRFGNLEVARSINPAAGTPFARQSNLDITTGEVIPPDDRRMIRSEEHTSELQSRGHLVCRLLLVKKKASCLFSAAPPSHVVSYP